MMLCFRPRLPLYSKTWWAVFDSESVLCKMSHSSGEMDSYTTDEEDIDVKGASRKEEVDLKPVPVSNLSRHASLERLKEETRLVVLDFLGSLPPEKLTARNFADTESRPDVLKKAIRRVRKSQSDAQAYERSRKKFLERSTSLRRKLSQNLKSDIESFNSTSLRRRESFKYKK